MNNAEIITEIEKLLVKLKGEEKKPRKLWEIIRCSHPAPDQGGHNQIYQHMAATAIAAVIECWYEYASAVRDQSFPEYLKEKLL